MKICVREVELNRYEAIIIKSLKEDITLTEARKRLGELNLEWENYKFPSSNGDTINANLILGDPLKEGEAKATDYPNKEVIEFYKNIDLEVSPDMVKENGELKYISKLCDEEISKRNKILFLNINKKIFISGNSILQQVIKKIEEKYPRGITNGSDREIAANGKKKTAAAKCIIYNGNKYVLTYKKFLFQDFFNKDFSFKSMEEIIENIYNRLKEITLFDLFLKEEPLFYEKVLKSIFEYKNGLLGKEIIRQKLTDKKITTDVFMNIIEDSSKVLNFLKPIDN